MMSDDVTNWDEQTPRQHSAVSRVKQRERFSRFHQGQRTSLSALAWLGFYAKRVEVDVVSRSVCFGQDIKSIAAVCSWKRHQDPIDPYVIYDENAAMRTTSLRPGTGVQIWQATLQSGGNEEHGYLVAHDAVADFEGVERPCIEWQFFGQRFEETLDFIASDSDRIAVWAGRHTPFIRVHVKGIKHP